MFPNLVMLAFLYTDFLMQTAVPLLGVPLPLLRKALPVGIPFYTFFENLSVLQTGRQDSHRRWKPGTGAGSALSGLSGEQGGEGMAKAAFGQGKNPVGEKKGLTRKRKGFIMTKNEM